MNNTKTAMTWLTVLAGFLFNGFDGLMWALITFIVLDYLTGVMSAVVSKELSSYKGARGIAKKILMFVIVIIANIADVQIIGENHILRGITIMFYITNECISILENAGNLGVPIPKKLFDVLKQLQNKEDTDNEQH